jgi:predicted acyltransferase
MTTKTIEQGAQRIGVTIPESREAGGRLVSLDVLRGLAVAGMILVTDPGTYSAVYPQLLHAQWNGATATDMIFPTFLFSVGLAITLSFRSRILKGESRGRLARHVVIRSVIMFFVGLALNGFPDYDFHTIRIAGVLQRIALCYLCAGFVYLGVSGARDEVASSRLSWRIGWLVFVILAGYWAVLKFVPVPGFGSNRLDSLGYLGAYIDRAVFGIRHLWPYGTTPGVGVTYDPEGILSTFPAIATTLLGVLAGEFLRRKGSLGRKAGYMAVVGLLMFVAGLLLNPVFPVNKRIWTSTFVLVSGGVSLMVFAALLYAVDVKQWKRWTPPLLVFGSNAILAFVLSNIVTTLTDRIHVGPLMFHQWANSACFATWLPAVNASLAYAIAIVLFNMAILWPLYRKSIFVRI